MMNKKVVLLLFCLSLLAQPMKAFNYGLMSAFVGEQGSSCAIVGCTIGFVLLCYGYERLHQKSENTEKFAD